MRKILILLVLLSAAGYYLYYVRGWDFGSEDSPAAEAVFSKREKETRPVGERGEGTHWETVKPMLTSRSEIGAARIGTKIYVVGGFDGAGRTLRTVEVYDIEKNEWSYGPPMPQALHHPAVTTDGKKLYVIGGYVGVTFNPLDTAYAYDPATDQWYELGRLDDFRGAATAAVVDGRLFVGGGTDLAGPANSAFEYDAGGGRWRQIASMPTPREHLASAAHGGKWYVAAGRVGFPDGNVDAFEIYDPATNAWKKLEPVPTPRGGFASAAVGDFVYVFGGERGDGTIAPVEAFDTRNGKWVPFGEMPTPRHGLAAVPYKNRIYVLGGGKRVGYSVSDVNEVLIIE